MKTSVPVPCEECGKTIANIVDGNCVAVDPSGWGMTDDERELCSECMKKKYNAGIERALVH